MLLEIFEFLLLCRKVEPGYYHPMLFDKALAEYEEDLMTKETSNLNIVIPESEFSFKNVSCFDAKNIFL